MQSLHFVLSVLGLTLGLSNPHKAITSSNPTNPTSGVLQSDFSSANSESWVFL